MSDKKAIDLEGLETFKENLDKEQKDNTEAINKSINNVEFFYNSSEGQGLKVTNNAGTVTTVGVPVAESSVNGFMSKEDKTKLDGIAAEANKYVHPTTAGNKHIPSGGSSGQILKWSASGTAVWGTPVLPVLEWKEKKTVPKGTGSASGNAITFSNLTTPCLLLIAGGAFSALYYINFAFESVITFMAGTENFSVRRTGSSDITISTSTTYDHVAYIIDIVKSNCP